MASAPSRSARRARRLAAAALLCLAPPVPATWSILLLDTTTGEIAVGSATCVSGINLRSVTPVVVVGRGAATAQAAVPGSIANRALIWRGLHAGTAPARILAELRASDPNHSRRQYGIVTARAANTFSGFQTGIWSGGVVGTVGTIRYAIQGNVLTGAAVVGAAERAVRSTAGDLAEKLMAAMEAAHSMGGDGRCSCTTGGPTSCGAPPASFRKSAHVGFMLVARQGDRDGTCTSTALGCAHGDYYLAIDYVGRNASPDPTQQLRYYFDGWRALQVGRPDHHLSSTSAEPPQLIADGRSSSRVTVVLRDWRGTRLPRGGATLRVAPDPLSTAPVGIGAVVDHGDGSYSFQITAGGAAGQATLRVTADDGGRPVLLWPPLDIPVTGDALWAGSSTLSARTGGTVALTLHAGAARTGRPYALAAGASGTTPGTALGAIRLPLNADPLVSASLLLANSPVLVNTAGLLDAEGRADAAFTPPAGPLLAPLAGTELHFAYALLAPIDFASNAVAVSIRP